MSKVIAVQNLKECTPWLVPSMEDDSRVPATPLATGEELESIRQQAREEGYEAGFKQGRKEGLDAAKAEAQERAVLLDRLMRGLARPFDELDRQVEEELAALAIAMTRQLIRRGIKENPGQVVAAVREAMNILPIASREMTLRVHPDDAVVIREHFFKEDAAPSWKVIEDPGIGRGGCKVTTESSSVDATIETRLAAVISRVFGGDRGGD